MAAYFIDYKLVPQRIRPGFEFHLSRHSLHCIYAALAAGLALGAICSRRGADAQVKFGEDPISAGSGETRRAYSNFSDAVVDR